MTVGEAFQLNPSVSLTRGTEAPFVDMASLEPMTRDVHARATKPFAGGMKFLDGDVLMARITPSLENGKTSIYRAPAGNVGPAFGSTEFIVIRGRAGVSDSTYAYYLFTSPAVRDHAIASMNGSSGRQRVQLDALASFRVNLPTLDEQRAIAQTLSALDDKIESNRRVTSIALELAIAILSTGTETVRVGDIAEVGKGLSYKGAGLDDGSTPGAIPLLNLANFTTTGALKHSGLKHYTGEHKAKHVVSTWDLITANTDLTQNRELLGRGFLVPPTLNGALHTHHTSRLAFFARPELAPVLWAQLQTSAFRDRAKGFATGTTVTALPAEAVLDFEIAIPESLDDSLALARSLVERAWHVELETSRLDRLRDALLPELLSGRLRVPRR
ncbi:restriction endonuclease subunit S [Agromyces sp. MMS24-JH15]|uniref:restriction endonuclease subunit S n=1 Tax=Agromyces sp. MMS24-JH15 TaxID=3243765 RepID=UPI003748DFC1